MDEGYDSVAMAVLAAVNAFPGLDPGERFRFAGLGQESGLALQTGSGPVILQERRSVTGRVRRLCALPFTVACRTGGAGERQRQDIAVRLETLGRWLEGQSVTVAGRDHCLAAYPALTGDRRLTAIRRAGPPRQADRQQDRTETWVMEMTANYSVWMGPKPYKEDKK